MSSVACVRSSTQPPKVWEVIEKVGKNGKRKKFTIQEIPEDRYEEAVQHMCTHFLADEPTCACSNSKDDPAFVKEISTLWRLLLSQGISVGAFTDNPDGGKSILAGINALGLNYKDKTDAVLNFKTEQFTVLWLLFAVIVAGNSAVLAGLLLGKRRKSRMDFFIKQLAFADLLVGLISVLTDIVWRATVTWYAGNIACKLIRFMQALVTYSSTYVLVALSIDRYDAITRPMNFSGSCLLYRLSHGGISRIVEVRIAHPNKIYLPIDFLARR